jgi:hypothetical protein
MLWSSLLVMTVTENLANECLRNDLEKSRRRKPAQDFASETSPRGALTA